MSLFHGAGVGPMQQPLFILSTQDKIKDVFVLLFKMVVVFIAQIIDLMLNLFEFDGELVFSLLKSFEHLKRQFTISQL
jgi:hypothetical protein